VLLAQLVLSGTSRISAQKRVLAEAESGDPLFCKDIKDYSNCGVHKRRCPASCAAGRYVDEKDSDAEKEDNKDRTQLEILRVTKKTRPVELTRVMKTSVYKEMWPDDCHGTNAKGETIEGLDIDGFVCEPTRGGLVPSVIHPMWHLRHSMCCDGACVDPKQCPGIKPKRFYEATQAVSTADSLKITQMETRSGATVSVNIKTAAPAVTEETGVVATVEVRMLQADMEFVKRKAELTEKGQKFIDELDEPLGALITMQMMVWPDMEGKVLFCAHGSTTARDFEIDRGLENLPQDRADAIRDHLAEAMESISGDIAVLGDAHGHFKEEVEGFDGGREAHIIYKIFDGTFENPGCQKEDLYEFKVKNGEYPDTAV
jgi:hypothetical protein